VPATRSQLIITPPIEIGGALAGYSSTGELAAWRVQ
jgi:hypothetical protein